ncbi:MAG: division/cell wall cluster transcriptional repressor MraZ [Clostridia bacterium]|nr:division/cell wall cluster transcriptional repressor MraZ [Clostridia bacterium]
MAILFSGSHIQTIDKKGRVTVPVAYRESLGEKFTVGLNGNFTTAAIYPQAKWETIGEKLARIPDTDEDGMRYVRLIIGSSFAYSTLDGQGRVLVPPTLRKKAGLLKSVVFVGMGEYFEMWDEDRYFSVIEADQNDKQLIRHVNETYFSPRRDE